MTVVEEEDVRIVFTSAGNPDLWTGFLKERNVCVVHVVSSVKFAKKAQQAGVDAVVAEGFEAGGHNGREETTTFVLIPMVREAISIPLIAAGGIASGRAILAAEALGAEGFQVGSRFAVSEESSAHENFKRTSYGTYRRRYLIDLKTTYSSSNDQEQIFPTSPGGGIYEAHRKRNFINYWASEGQNLESLKATRMKVSWK